MDALCASLLPDEEINQLNFRAGLQSGPKVVLILSRGFTQSKQPIACSFLPLVLGGLAFLSRTYDFLDDSASSSFPSNSAKCDCTLWFLCMFPFCLFHCDCQFPFVCMCVGQCSLSSSLHSYGAKSNVSYRVGGAQY